jgi:hypothetical protein
LRIVSANTPAAITTTANAATQVVPQPVRRVPRGSKKMGFDMIKVRRP